MSENWKIPARMRLFESGDAPRETYFCIDPAEQQFWREQYLLGADPLDIRKEWTRRKQALEALEATTAATGATETDERDEPADRWASPSFEGSRPRYE